jgi:NADPH2:quinone reductase
MRAAQLMAFGGPEQVQVVDLPDPTAGPGEVVVAVRAAALNYPDLLLMAGKYQVSVAPPFVVGSEFAGRVLSVGPGVRNWQPGDRVSGAVMTGAFAEQVVLPAAGLEAVPDAVDWPSAAAFGVAYRTAYHALVSFGQITAGAQVLIPGAAGGVGSACIDLAVAAGARVIAVTSSPARAEFARSRGAAVTLDRNAPDLRAQLKATAPGGVDLIVDAVGGPLSELMFRSMRWGGRFVVVGFASGEIPRIPLNLPLIKGALIVGFELRTLGQRRPDFVEHADRALAELVSRGLRPPVGAVHELDDVVVALRQMANAEFCGKSVIRIAGGIGDEA